MSITVESERRLASLVRVHDRWRAREVFNLLPSENVVSPAARRFLGSDLAGRYTLPGPHQIDGETVDNLYGGTRYSDEIEGLADAAARRLFRVRNATTRPLSGHIAAMCALVPLLPKGSTFLAIPPEAGGYDGYGPGFLESVLSYRMRPLPSRTPADPMDPAEVAAQIRSERPSAVILGQSVFLFPYPLREIAEEAHAADSLVFYDGSHVLGLIAGGTFQDPLREGADVVYGSSHKTLPGPQGGLLLTDRDDLFAKIEPALVWKVLDNAHWHRIAALGQTLLEMERVGPEYARTTIANAQALGTALSAEGLPLLGEARGFTASHQLVMDVPKLRAGSGLGVSAIGRRWERNRLITDLVGRLGTAEIARLGLVPQDMPRLANLLVRAGLRGERVGPEVLAWRKSFRGIRFL
jgi:glycine hydroxymethyltransferase